MRNVKSRIEKVEEAVCAEKKPLLVWVTSYSECTDPKDVIEDFTKPIEAGGTDVRVIPFHFSPQLKAWVIANWGKIVPEAQEEIREMCPDICQLQTPCK